MAMDDWYDRCFWQTLTLRSKSNGMDFLRRQDWNKGFYGDQGAFGRNALIYARPRLVRSWPYKDRILHTTAWEMESLYCLWPYIFIVPIVRSPYKEISYNGITNEVRNGNIWLHGSILNNEQWLCDYLSRCQSIFISAACSHRDNPFIPPLSFIPCWRSLFFKTIVYLLFHSPTFLIPCWRVFSSKKIVYWLFINR
jgi:hypothetical protein